MNPMKPMKPMKSVLITSVLMALWLWCVSALWVSYSQWPAWYIYAATALIWLVISAQGIQLARQFKTDNKREQTHGRK